MIQIDGNHLTLAEVAAAARTNEAVELTEEGRRSIMESRKRLERILLSNQPVYGINTGFGIFAEQRIPPEDSARLSRNLILSHSVGTGPAFPSEVVRAAMLVRANTLAKGYSGVRMELVQILLEMLNRGVTPSVPSLGSLGSSGDLTPLSHLALVFSTDEADRDDESGYAEYEGQRLTGKQAMERAGLARIRLGPKEGLAINNGATFSAAIAALALYDADYLVNAADAALAMSLEALIGCSDAFDARIHTARGLAGQMLVAERIRRLIEGSTLVDSSARVQDAYSLRCAPQVQGASRDTLRFVQGTIEAEINAATDNPLLFDTNEALSGGNFHGEPVGMAMDYLGIAMAEIAAISERRTFRLINGKMNYGLPPMLVDSPEAAGLNSGLMMPQYTAAALVLANQTLASPDSVLSLPTSGGQEDLNANAMNAALHARQIVENAAQVLAIEVFTAARAIDLRLRMMPGARLGEGTAQVYERVRAAVPYQPGDAWWGPEIARVRELINRKELVPLAGN